MYIMWNDRLDESQAGIKIAGKNINNLRYADDTTLMDREQRGTKDPPDESERRKWKNWLKTQHSENKDDGIWFHHFMADCICKTEKETQMYRTDFWTMWEKVRVGCFKKTSSKHVYYLGWNRSLAQVGCMRQVLGPGALGRPRGIGWRGRWEGGLRWGIHVNPWWIHVNVWQNPYNIVK